MMARRITAALAAAVLGSGLAIGAAAPAVAATTHRASGTGPTLSATLEVRTVPRMAGVRIIFDGATYLTNRRGAVVIQTVAGGHRIGIRPPRSLPPGTKVAFSRWLDGLALANRTITLSPGLHVEQAGLDVFHPIAVRFTDTAGRPVPLSAVTQITVASSQGERYTFSPDHPPQALQVARIVRNQAGLAPLPIRYSVREVVIDNSNVVYGGSQNFFVHPSTVWTIEVLLFPMHVEVRDALFKFPIGSTVKLTMPDGTVRLIGLGAGHAVTIPGLPRATYQLAARGAGIGLTSPSTLTKPQVARLLLLSWIDIGSAAAFALFFLIGLPVLGGRVVRRSGPMPLPIWLPRRHQAQANSADVASGKPRVVRGAVATVRAIGSIKAAVGAAVQRKAAAKVNPGDPEPETVPIEAVVAADTADAKADRAIAMDIAARAHADPHPGPGPDAGLDLDAAPDADAGLDPDADTDAGLGQDAGLDPDADTEPDADPASDPDPERVPAEASTGAAGDGGPRVAVKRGSS